MRVLGAWEIEIEIEREIDGEREREREHWESEAAKLYKAVQDRQGEEHELLVRVDDWPQPRQQEDRATTRRAVIDPRRASGGDETRV